MKDKDQQLLAEAYQSIYNKGLLVEKVYGNIAVVYHRKQANPEDSDLFTKGVGGADRPGAATSGQTQGEIQKSKYGTGLYACYDFNSQLKRQMAETYGEFIVKGKVDLSNFFFLDEEAFKVARPRENFLDHLNSLRVPGEAGEPGFNFYEFDKFKKRVQLQKITKADRVSLIGVSLEIWPLVKRQGFAGMMYPNEFDGKVAVIFDRQSFLPFQYGYVPVKEIKRLLALPEDQREKAVEWTSKAPDIKSIKRGQEAEYDADFQKQSARNILRLNITKQSTVPFLNLDLLTDLSNAQFPYIKQCTGEVRLVEYRRDPTPVRVSLPNLEEASTINLSSTKEGSVFDLRNLRRVKRSLSIITDNSIQLDNLESCGERVWITHPQLSQTPKEVVSLSKLRTCTEINIPKTSKIVLSSLQSCKGGIHAPECMEIVLPTTFKGRKKLGRGCKITLVQPHSKEERS